MRSTRYSLRNNGSAVIMPRRVRPRRSIVVTTSKAGTTMQAATTRSAVLAASSIGQVEGLLSGPLILAGAAQLMAVQMLDDGVTPFVIVFSALLINARIVLYSAAMAPWFREESLGRRLLLAIPLIDPLYFVAGARFDRCDLDRRHRQALPGRSAPLAAGALARPTGPAGDHR